MISVAFRRIPTPQRRLPMGVCILPTTDSKFARSASRCEYSSNCGIAVASVRTGHCGLSDQMEALRSIYTVQIGPLPVSSQKVAMNPLKALQQFVQRNYPEARTDLIAPLDSHGVWSLDVDLAEKHLAIEWSRATGFGVSSASDENYGEGPDEMYGSLEDAQQRVDQLLTTNERTSPSFPVLLSRLRERQGVTQQELATRLGIRQATISGLEHREDVQVSTLRRVIEALGGKL